MSSPDMLVQRSVTELPSSIVGDRVVMKYPIPSLGYIVGSDVSIDLWVRREAVGNAWRDNSVNEDEGAVITAQSVFNIDGSFVGCGMLQATPIQSKSHRRARIDILSRPCQLPWEQTGVARHQESVCQSMWVPRQTDLRVA